MNDLGQSELKRLLRYDPDTGLFTWRVSRTGAARSGTSAGGVTGRGYIRIKVNGKKYFAHRLAWIYTNGEWPRETLDHINGDRSDNRISNLREATKSENQHNVGVRSNSDSGLKGVGFQKAGGKWVARIWVHGERKHLGSFDTPEAAHDAYCTVAKDLHGEFFNDGKQARP